MSYTVKEWAKKYGITEATACREIHRFIGLGQMEKVGTRPMRYEWVSFGGYDGPKPHDPFNLHKKLEPVGLHNIFR